jgi:hypothetical protein
MTTVYKLVCGYTKAGVATSPSSAPTITIVDSGNNVLASAQATTARTNIAGVYDYSYSGADSLDLIGLFHTTDTTVDRQDLHSHPYDALILASISVLPTVATIWDRLLTAITTAGSVGKLIKDNLDAAVSTRATPADVTVNASVAVTTADAVVLAAGNVAFTSYAHTSQIITSTSTEDLASATKVWFALKDSYLETDAQSLIFIEKTAGLTHVGKSAIVSPIVTTDGSLTVSGSSGAWVFTVVLKSEAAAYLADYAGSGKLGEIKATIGGLDKVIGTVTGAINSGVIRTNA